MATAIGNGNGRIAVDAVVVAEDAVVAEVAAGATAAIRLRREILGVRTISKLLTTVLFYFPN